CLAQTHPRVEIIVVIDACPDGSEEIAESYARKHSALKVIRFSQNRGISAALNAGFAAAAGTLFTRLAQDDLFAPDAFKTMAAYLGTHSECGMVYCDFQWIDERGNVIGDAELPDPDRVLVEANKVGLCVMWRRSVWEQVGTFDSRYDS